MPFLNGVLMIKKILLFALLLTAASCTTAPSVKTDTSKMALPAGSYRAYALKGGINIRSTPVSGAVVRQTEEGEEFIVFENKNGWYRVETLHRETGWIRSDFVGPESMSYAKRSAVFAEKVLPAYHSQIFIDENKPYRVIYLVLEPGYYQSVSQAAQRARQIGQKYQQTVYPGAVEIRVMPPDSKKVFTKITLPAIDATLDKAPFLRFGRLYGLKLKNRHLFLKLLIPSGLSRDQLLDMADEVAAAIGDDVRKVEMVFVENTPAGLAWLQGKPRAEKNSACRLYFLEDANGADYKFNHCPQQAQS